MSKTKKIVLWLVSPYVLLIIGMIVFSVSSFIFNGSPDTLAVDGAVATAPVAWTITSTIVYLMGMVAVVLIPVSIVMAVLIGTRKP